MSLFGKRILLGISGGIAAYKAPILVRRLRQAGAEVQVVLTHAAREFVTPATLAAVAGAPPRTELFDLTAEAAMGHIELARWADCVLIAPATAHCLAQLAHGMAGDLLTTLCLATRAPVILYPAMNNVMWTATAVQSNIAMLRSFGHIVRDPDAGEQACGETGPGRMPEPETITKDLEGYFSISQRLQGLHILITAGPTREAIDPVRFISNHSSGKQGYALAEAALGLGATVTLVSGPTSLDPPAGARVVRIESAREMLDAVLSAISGEGIDAFIGVAAVADYRPRVVVDQKIKRVEHGMESVELVPNPDIIATVAAHPKRPRLVVGFAAETEHALEHARAKRIRKQLDSIIVNDVSNKAIGFNSDENAATLITAGEEVHFPARPKRDLARDLLLALYEERTGRLAPTNPPAR